jgi:hypothetical protein
VEEKVRSFADRAWGIVTRAELLGSGVSSDEVRGRVAKGYLIPEHPGVYRVGHAAPSTEASYMAAVKAGGAGAVLSHRAAAYLWHLLKGKPPPPEVTAPRERRLRGVRTIRAARPAARRRGIPVTSVPETLVDLAPLLTLDELARACHEAGVLHKTTPAHVEAVLRRRAHAAGARRLRAVMRGDAKVTLSRLERAFLELVRDARLPLPQTNRLADGRRMDCRWPEQRLTVELDSFTFHNSRYGWERDRQGEKEARKRRDRFRRFTYGDVTEDAQYVAGELERLLVSSCATFSRGGP